MSKHVASFLFENSVLPPLWSAWLVGYCIIDTEGTVWLTNFGQAYLERSDL